MNRIFQSVLFGSTLLLGYLSAEEGDKPPSKDVGALMVHRWWDHLSADDPRISRYFANLASHLNRLRANGPTLIFLIDAQIADRRMDHYLEIKLSLEEREKVAGLTGTNINLGGFLIDFCARNDLEFQIQDHVVTIMAD